MSLWKKALTFTKPKIQNKEKVPFQGHQTHPFDLTAEEKKEDHFKST